MKCSPLREDDAAQSGAGDNINSPSFKFLGDHATDPGSQAGVGIESVFVDINAAVFAGSVNKMAIGDDGADLFKNGDDIG